MTLTNSNKNIVLYGSFFDAKYYHNLDIWKRFYSTLIKLTHTSYEKNVFLGFLKIIHYAHCGHFMVLPI